MKAYLHRRYHFSASHRLHAESLSAETNQATFGKCNNPFGHGHNYLVTVTVSGSVDPVTGMVVSLADLDRFAQQHLIELFDQTNLNTLPSFASLVPSTENLTLVLHGIFTSFPYAHVEHIHVEETSNNFFDFPGQPHSFRGRL